ncbi:hypothetical protein HRG_005578 [Hirsutella rhossiliensis]|uniref:WHIM1 domain-containing protein n=1 Tax=Hirsutella rhossiliensis TaxID=111463 RepID=A0A9P8MVQ2_9HYPO|nr:uncharacterized protein HRG_05578 [Hirsutella rhossiliensis]KAH0963068.1 hypothetical protein HRG_05578 [Hirsutella rhossiliensis]
MAPDDDSSDLSSLSSLSPAPSDSELDGDRAAAPTQAKPGLLKFFPKLSGQPAPEPSQPPRKRSPSPPHEYVLADNPDIAFIVMFRSRFSDAFPKALAHFGPQELERDVVESIPGDRVEHFLCALLGLLLNRKQDVKPGHYGRALEDAIASHKSQWPSAWKTKNPLSGGSTFNSMTPNERLTLLRTLILWTMASSETVKALINQSYKQNRHEDDLNQPRAVKPWGSDGDKRRYFLVEGQDDTNFRVYRESNPAGATRTWWSVAGSIEELKALAGKLETKDGGPKAKALSHKILTAVPRFEAGEEKRKRRDYRQMRKEQFKRPEPGYSLYEGRTRGKRMKYTYSDDEDTFLSDSTGNRRSTRNTAANTPAETGPVTTSSGRQVRAPPRLNMVAGESAPGSVQGDGSEYDQEKSLGASGRPRRSAAVNHANGLNGTGRHRNGSADTHDDDDDDDDGKSEDEEEFEEDEVDSDEKPRSLVVKLSVTPPRLRTVLAPANRVDNTSATSEDQGRRGNTRTADTVTVGTPEAPAQDSISVVDGASRGAASSFPGAAGEPTSNGPDNAEKAREQSPSAAAPTSLAFRGSPEQASVQPRLPNGDGADEK